MRHIRHFRLLITAFAVAGATHAWAADFGSDAAPPPAAPKAVTDTISLDVTPEWGALTGAYADTVLKLGWSHVLGQGWTWGASLGEQFRPSGITQTALETTIGYGGIKLSDMVSLPVSAGIGYVWDGQAGPTDGSYAWAYYLVSLGLNVKFDSHWTWNVVSARYRDAFQGGWVTPKVQTGVTYAFDPRTAVYANVGYSWKNGNADKISTTWGVRFGF